MSTSESSSAVKIEISSATSKDVTGHRRTNTRMIQNVLLIWFDSNIDKHEADYQNIIIQLQRTVKNVNTFTNGDECIQFIQTIDYKNKACMIISGYLGKQIVPQIHSMSQVDSIFILCGNQKCHEQWAKEWPKIKGVFTEIAPICEALKVVAQQCEQNAIPISFMATGEDASKKKLDQLDCSFMYTQILKNILLNIHFEQHHIQTFIDQCREQFIDNEGELSFLKDMEKKYHKKTPIWWYTCQSFLYPMLNTALRLLDVDLIIKMGFFIQHLHRQIEQLHQEQFANNTCIFTVFRGQGMSQKDFQQLIQTKGGLMAFNNFLSTSKTRNVSLSFAHNALFNPDLVGILFVLSIDPSKSTTPFASVNGVSYFEDQEDEVLFSMHTIFRIHDIKSLDGKDRLYQVDLTLTDANDKDLRLLSDRMEEEMKESTGWYRLGDLLLMKLDQPMKAEVVYQLLLEQASEEIDQALIYHKLGWAKCLQGEYKEALKLYDKSLIMRQKLFPPNHPDLAKSYNNIGLVYESMHDYSKALLYYEKTLEIDQKTLSLNHPDLAKSYNNIGLIYYNMIDYSKALSYYEKAFAIQQQSLPFNHPDLAKSYGSIGNVYYNMGDYSRTLLSYEKALEIQQQSLPPNHPDVGKSYNNIGLVYYNMGDYSKALSYYRKALEIKQQSLPPTHPDLASLYNNIGALYENMDNYSEAVAFYERATDIAKQSVFKLP